MITLDICRRHSEEALLSDDEVQRAFYFSILLILQYFL